MKSIFVISIIFFSKQFMFSQGNFVLSNSYGFDILKKEDFSLLKKSHFPGASFSLAIDYKNNLIYSIHDGTFIRVTNLSTQESAELPVDQLGKQKLQYNAKNNRLYYLVDRVVYEYDLNTFQSYPCTSHRITNYKYYAGDSLIVYVKSDTLFAYSIFNKSNDFFFKSPGNVRDVIIDNTRQKIYFSFLDIFNYINLAELDLQGINTSTISIESTEFRYIDEANGFLYYYISEINQIKRLNLVTKKIEAIADLLPIFKNSKFLKGIHDEEILILSSTSCDYLTSLSFLTRKYSELLSVKYQNLNFQKFDPYRNIYWLTMKYDSTRILYRSKIDAYDPVEIMRFPAGQSPSDIDFISENDLVITIPSSQEIIRFNMPDKKSVLLFKNPNLSSKITSINIDYASDYIFWWDSNTKSLNRMHFDATNLTPVEQNIKDGNFCINPIDKILYWTNEGKFYKSDYNGHKVLVADNSIISRKGYSIYGNGYFDSQTKNFYILHFFGDDNSEGTGLLEMKPQDTIPKSIKSWSGSVYSSVAYYNESSTSTKIVENNYFTVYPNPFANKINIHFKDNQNEKLDLNIYNSIGQKLYHQLIINPSENATIDLSSLKSDIYLLEVLNKKIRSTSLIQKMD